MDILVVDDSKVIRMVVSKCVSALGHRVKSFEKAEEAVSFVDKNNVDLVLMDVEMPGLDGFEATRLIRENKPDEWFPIIFLTSLKDDESFVKGITSGGDAYLSKPISTVRLEYTIVAMERIYAIRNKLNELQKVDA